MRIILPSGWRAGSSWVAVMHGCALAGVLSADLDGVLRAMLSILVVGQGVAVARRHAFRTHPRAVCALHLSDGEVVALERRRGDVAAVDCAWWFGAGPLGVAVLEAGPDREHVVLAATDLCADARHHLAVALRRPRRRVGR